MRLARALMTGFAITGVTGCVTMKDPEKLLAEAKICCRGPHECRYKDLPSTGELDVSISRESPVFEFPTGRSYFVALRREGYSG